MRNIFKRSAKKTPEPKNEFRVSDLAWHLATYARKGEIHTKTISDDKGNTAAYSVDYFSNSNVFAFQMNLSIEGKTYETSLTAEKSGPHMVKITSFVFDNKTEPLKTRKETFNALNHIVNQIRAIELSGRMPAPHHPFDAPYNKISRTAIRLYKNFHKNK